MSTCADCKYYQSTDDTSGTCFGNVVQAGQDAGECPANSFEQGVRGGSQ